jgi:hypothetical protein
MKRLAEKAYPAGQVVHVAAEPDEYVLKHAQCDWKIKYK